MKKHFLYKLLISFFIFFAALNPVNAVQDKVISLVPSITEIIYFLGLEDNLLAITRDCNYPKAANNKEKIGNAFSINKEKILDLYLKNGKKLGIYALASSKIFLSDLEALKGVEFQYFEFKNIQNIYDGILRIGKTFGIEGVATSKISKMKTEIAKFSAKNTGNGKKILYLIQTEPMITIGKESYISDVIKHSGNISITDNLHGEYPPISKEYAAKLDVDIIVIDNFQIQSNLTELKRFFPNTEFVQLTREQTDIINRPSPRVVEAVKFFHDISN